MAMGGTRVLKIIYISDRNDICIYRKQQEWASTRLARDHLPSFWNASGHTERHAAADAFVGLVQDEIHVGAGRHAAAQNALAIPSFVLATSIETIYFPSLGNFP